MITKFLARSPQFLRFFLVGVANTLVHAATLSIEVELFHLNVVLANMGAFLVANLFSYFTNARVTFDAKPSVRSYAKFFAASLLGLSLTLLISWITDYLGFHYMEGFLVIVVLVPLISFFAVKFFVFSK